MVTGEDVPENLKQMQAEWQHHQGTETLFSRTKNGVAFTVFTQKLIDRHTMVDSFLVVIKATGQYHTYYEEWM